MAGRVETVESIRQRLGSAAGVVSAQAIGLLGENPGKQVNVHGLAELLHAQEVFASR